MAVRIYVLAKELNVDNKALVDMCAQAGVTGKGSALANLTDEEVAIVKAFVASGGKVPQSKPAVKVSPSVAPTAAPTDAGQFRREDYIPPAGASGKPPAVTGKSLEKISPDGAKKAPAAESGKPATPRTPPKQGPAIRLAPVPTALQPVVPATPAEPAPQKPDLKLPADAIRAASRGSASPLEMHVRKTESKRKPETPTKKGGADSAAIPPVAPTTELPSSRDRGKKTAKGGVEGPDVLGGREQRQLNRKRPAGGERPGPAGEDEGARELRRMRMRSRKTSRPVISPRRGKIVVDLPCTVRSFSEQAGVRVPQVQGKLMGMGTMATITSELSAEQVELLAVELGLEIEIKQAISEEDRVLQEINQPDADPALRIPRPPVVTFLGHVDHGKTSLLDRILSLDVAKGESGGITQHIRAYRIDRDGTSITFVDTPGHEAFTQMRARGANVTDIAVLVVAADDGVMPQTEEAISHARAADVPIVVALNKTDLPGINYDRIYNQLVTAGLQPSDWGGETELVRCSALKGTGIKELLETIQTLADIHDFRANPLRAARGTCLEAEQQEGRGVVVKFLVQDGTLRPGDVVVCGAASGRVKAMYDTIRGSQQVLEAGPSTPVNLTGLDVVPDAGDPFYVVPDISDARALAQRRIQSNRQTALGGMRHHVTLENLHDRLGQAEVQTLNIILRADFRGSVEAILKELGKLHHDEVQIKVLQSTVGGITEADVHLADVCDAIIIGFNVVPDDGAAALAERLGVQIRRYDIIYQVTDDLRAAIEGMLKPERRDVELGRALVQRAFSISRVGTVAGCRVLSGNIERNSRVRVIRDSRVMGDYPLESLKREKDDAREVREGLECGIKLAGFNDIKEGDILEVYRVEEFARTL